MLDSFCQGLESSGFAVMKQNLGFRMASSREGVQRMRLDASPADVVLINFGLVDTWITSIPKIYVPYYPETAWRNQSRKLLKSVKRRLRWPRIRRWIPTGSVVPIDEYTQNNREMIAIARAANPDVAVVLWGCPPVQDDPARNANLSHYNHQLELLAEETHALFLSTTEIIQHLSNQEAYIDAVHLSEAATDAIAHQLILLYQDQTLAAAPL